MKTKFNSLRNGGGKIVFCVTLMCTLIFSSCNKDERVLSSAVPKPNETPEQYLERRMNDFKESGKTVTVEHATLDEINATMRKYNMPEVSRKELYQAKQLRNCYTYPCSAWYFLGDWNQNGVLSTLDLVLSQQYLLQNGNCMGTNCYLDLGITFNHPDAAWNFYYLNVLNCTTDLLGNYMLSYVDQDALRQYFLGIIDCN